jgi:hypothetical protein
VLYVREVEVAQSSGELLTAMPSPVAACSCCLPSPLHLYTQQRDRDIQNMLFSSVAKAMPEGDRNLPWTTTSTNLSDVARCCHITGHRLSDDPDTRYS